jgi:hypothetical protein
LVPIVKGRLDDRKFREQRIFESRLARQGKVIDAQAKLLDDLSELFTGFLLLMLSITFYASHENAVKADKAFRDYDEKAWEYFMKLRVEIDKAQRLTSTVMYEALTAVYREFFQAFDLELVQAAANTPIDSFVWKVLHDKIQLEGKPRVNAVLADLAAELRLTSEAVGTTSS